MNIVFQFTDMLESFRINFGNNFQIYKYVCDLLTCFEFMNIILSKLENGFTNIFESLQKNQLHKHFSDL